MVKDRSVVSTGNVDPAVIHALDDFDLRIPSPVLLAEIGGSTTPESANTPLETLRIEVAVLSAKNTQAGPAFVLLVGIGNESR